MAPKEVTVKAVPPWPPGQLTAIVKAVPPWPPGQLCVQWLEEMKKREQEEKNQKEHEEKNQKEEQG